MEIEAELPDKFEEMSPDEKIEELEKLLEDLDSVMKREIVRELIEHYRSEPE